MALRPIVLAHANDPHWIIELWLKIHGGDPAPDVRVVNKATIDIVKALVPHLDAAKQKAVLAALG
ncbi:hypothetical protein DMC18_21555 [Caulobacter sp. D5]|uniref:hypothetical protein n=1 Tax=Caulobacter sp. D5 TaxID=357400 RepID=UPI000D739DFE|nr:hypothetical protein [Caulobacter sp. D5]PXA86827.1 hypothetical protein DMC18_21555 [Caulobacter sp. D5]